MALIRRFSRLLSADLHAVLDRLEDPSALLQQAHREMAAALAEEKALLARTDRSVDLLDQRLERTAAQLATLQAELDLCFAAADEGLARSVLKRRLQCSAEHDDLSSQRTALVRQRTQLQERVGAHQADLDTITAEADRLSAQLGDLQTAMARRSDPGITDEAIELALLAERRARGVRS